jgi:hypothetical protein
MTSSAQPSWLVWHENDIPALGLALHRIAVQRGQGRAELGIARLGKARHGRRSWPSLSGHGFALPVVARQGQHRKPGIPQRCSVWPSSHSTARPAGIAWQGWAWHGTAVLAAAKPEAGVGQLDYIEFSSVLAATERRRYKSVLDSGSELSPAMLPRL